MSQRGRQTGHIELGRMEQIAKCPNLPLRLLQKRGALQEEGLRHFAATRCKFRQTGKVERDADEVLCSGIVQLARDASPFLILSTQQSSARSNRPVSS
jgi:hypothetical protein